MRAWFGRFVVGAMLALAGTVQASDCANLAGDYVVDGLLKADSDRLPIGEAVNLLAVLYPHNNRTYNTHIVGFKLFNVGNDYLIEWRTPEGVLDYWNLLSRGDKAVCAGGRLVIERDRSESIGMSHFDRHYRHVVSRGKDGALSVRTDIVRRTTSGFNSWLGKPEHYNAYFEGTLSPFDFEPEALPATASGPRRAGSALAGK